MDTNAKSNKATQEQKRGKRPFLNFVMELTYRKLDYADVQMSRCADEQMCKCADVQMSRCANVQMSRCANVQMSKCADEQMCR